MSLEWLRDLAIVVFAILGAVASILFIVIGVVLYRRVKPILDSVKVTLANIRSTSTFISDNVVKPVIAASSWVQGVRHAIAVISKLSQRKERKSE